MSTAITLNAIFIAAVVVGWTVAVWAFYRHLGDPHARPEIRYQPDVVRESDTSSQLEPVGRRAD